MKKNYCKYIYLLINLKIYRSELEKLECPYLAKFYYSTDKEYVHKLMMEYYPNKSLDYFKLNFLSTMSLNTKIYLLF